MQTPYFVEYRVEDVDEFEASADYGALTRREKAHQRILRVTVRIGDYKMDNSTPQGNGTAQLATVDDDVMALRYALWSATDDAYKSALRGYSAKQAQLKGFQTPPTADDFAMAKPVTQVDPLVKLSIDQPLWRSAWRRRVDGMRAMRRKGVCDGHPVFDSWCAGSGGESLSGEQ